MKLKFRSPFVVEENLESKLKKMNNERISLEEEINALNKQHEKVMDDIKHLKHALGDKEEGED